LIPFPKKKYKIIYADPPWEYENKTLGRDLDGGAEYHYDTMSLEEIKSLPIKKIMDNDCMLFLWATNPQLPEAFEVMKSWEFKYKTTLTWHKIPKNKQAVLGFWFRGYTEHLLFGIKGNVKALRCIRPNIYPNHFRT